MTVDKTAIFAGETVTFADKTVVFGGKTVAFADKSIDFADKTTEIADKTIVFAGKTVDFAGQIRRICRQIRRLRARFGLYLSEFCVVCGRGRLKLQDVERPGAVFSGQMKRESRPLRKCGVRRDRR